MPNGRGRPAVSEVFRPESVVRPQQEPPEHHRREDTVRTLSLDG